MSGRLLAGVIWSLLTLIAGGFTFLVLSVLMTGSDLRNRTEFAIFVTVLAIITVAVVTALVLIWKSVLR